MIRSTMVSSDFVSADKNSSRRQLIALAVCAALGLSCSVVWAQETLPASLSDDLAKAAEMGSEALTQAAREATNAHPELADAISFEALALALENAVRNAPAHMEDLVADAMLAADRRGLLTDGEKAQELRMRAKAAQAAQADVMSAAPTSSQGNEHQAAARRAQAVDALISAVRMEAAQSPSQAADILAEAQAAAIAKGLTLTRAETARLYDAAMSVAGERAAMSASQQTQIEAQAEKKTSAKADQEPDMIAGVVIDQKGMKPKEESIHADDIDQRVMGGVVVPEAFDDTARDDRDGFNATNGLTVGGVVLAGGGTVLALGGSDGGNDTPSIEDFQTDEFEGMGALSQVNAEYAYARGAFGQGVTVAVASSGIELRNPELFGQIAAGSTDLLDGDDDIQEEGIGGFSSSGTYLSGLIAAKRGGPEDTEFPDYVDARGVEMHGVAPESEVLALRVVDAEGNGYRDEWTDSVNTAVFAGADAYLDERYLTQGFYKLVSLEQQETEQNSGLVTLAVRDFSTEEYQSIRAATEQDMVFVVPAGYLVEREETPTDPDGDGESEEEAYGYLPANYVMATYAAIVDDEGVEVVYPSAEALVPTVYPEFQDSWIAVVSVSAEEAENVDQGSAECGQAADWCIAAPSAGLVGPAWFNDTRLEGTPGYASFHHVDHEELLSEGAAAVVAGGFAVIKSMFPELTNEQVREILLLTASDLGDSGVDAVFGHGLMNLERATRPLGENGVNLDEDVDGVTAPLSESFINPGLALGGDFVKRVGDLELGFIDGYQRAYLTPLSSVTTGVRSGFDFVDRAVHFGGAETWNTAMLGDSVSALYQIVQENSGHEVKDAPYDKTEDKIHRVSLNISTEAGDLSLNQNHSLDGRVGLVAQGVVEEGGALHESLFQNPYISEVSRGIGASFESRANNGSSLTFGAMQGHDEDRNEDDSSAFAAVAEYAMPLKAGTLALQGGAVMEQTSVLGSSWKGAFKLAEATPTLFAGVSGSVPLADNTRLFAQAMGGVTRPQTTSASLVSGIDPLISTSFVVGLSRAALWRKDDSLQIGLGQPLAVTHGSATFLLPQGRSGGQVVRAKEKVDIAAEAREWALESVYRIQPDSDTSFASGVLLRYNADHVDGALDAAAVVRYEQNF